MTCHHHRAGTLTASCLGAVCALGWSIVPAAARAQQGDAWTIVPSVTVRETITDNRDLSSSGGRADSITEIIPGVQITKRGGALRGTLGYSMSGIVNARASDANSVQHSLNAGANLDLADGRFGMAAAASMSQQVISAFGQQAPSPAYGNSNQTAVGTYSLSPYLKGVLLGEVTYSARASYSASHSSKSTLGDSSSSQASLNLGRSVGRLTWGLSANRTFSDNKAGGDNRLGSAVASAGYVPDVDWQFSVRAGQEWNDLRTGANAGSTTWGLGASWSPGPRTRLDLQGDKRFFGHSHTVAFSHRLARSVVSYSDSRDLNLSGASGIVNFSNYDLVYSQLASIRDPDFQRLIQDPVERDRITRDLLRQYNLDPRGVATTGFLTAGPTVVRRQVLTLLWQGLRTTLTFNGTRSVSGSGSTLRVGSDDLSFANSVRQTGITLTVSHRLTPMSSLSFTAGSLRTAASGNAAGTDTLSLQGSWSQQLSQHADFSLSVRHVDFSSDSRPYQETALIGLLSMRF